MFVSIRPRKFSKDDTDFVLIRQQMLDAGVFFAYL